MSTAVRAALGAALLIVAVLLFAVLQGGDDGDSGGAGTPAPAGSTARPPQRPQKPTPPPVPHIVVRGGAPVGEPATITVGAGERVRFRVSSDTAEEIHVHGYDITREVPAGGTATVSFEADLEGIYEVELHGSGELIAELRVEP